MSEQKQIEEMRKDLIEIFDEEYEKRRIITADFTAIKMTAKGYRKQSGWISVDERLPDLYGTYLIHTCNNHVKLGRFCEWAIGFAPSFDDYTVTHWMPLPEPPKGE